MKKVEEREKASGDFGLAIDFVGNVHLIHSKTLKSLVVFVLQIMLSAVEISQQIFFSFLFEKQNSQVTLFEWCTHK